jgi:hypothetical protein
LIDIEQWMGCEHAQWHLPIQVDDRTDGPKISSSS